MRILGLGDNVLDEYVNTCTYYTGIDTSRYPYENIHSIAHNDDYHLYDL